MTYNKGVSSQILLVSHLAVKVATSDPQEKVVLEIQRECPFNIGNPAI